MYKTSWQLSSEEEGEVKRKNGVERYSVMCLVPNKNRRGRKKERKKKVCSEEIRTVRQASLSSSREEKKQKK